MLAVLLASANRAVTIERLLDEIWGDRAGEGASHALQTYVSSLRRVLGRHRIERAGLGGYLIRIDPDELDAIRFAAEVRRGCALVARQPSEAEGLLAEALQLWRGRPYDEIDERIPALVTDAARLEELRLAAVEGRIEATLRRGGDGMLIADLRATIAEDPLRERPRAQLMVALYRNGRQTEALAEYRAFRAMLVSDLGLDPSPELQRLEQRILLQDPTLEAIGASPPHNLPAPITRLVGRLDEISELEALLAEERLLTLTGVAGVGKSRLALELALGTRSWFGDGSWWIDLAPVSDPRRVMGAVAKGLGVGESAGAQVHRRLLSFVRPRTLLLILDNCEHLAAACAHVASLLLAAAPGLKIVATSRVPLRLTGEHRHRVPPLGLPVLNAEHDLPTAESEAVRLFVDRARAISSGFAVGAGNRAAVVGICRQLDGIPLALELAAARVNMMSPDEILEGLADRFSILIGESEPARAADSTLRRALDWSFRLLAADEQAYFRRLGTFVGGFTRDAADAVAMDAASPAPTGAWASPLERLVEMSMVEPDLSGESQGRFRLLETLRAYALDRLADAGEHDATAARHTEYFRRLASSAEADFGTARRFAALRRVEADIENIEAALAWSVVHAPPAHGFGLIRAAVEAWHNRGFLDTAGRWAERLLDGELAAVPAGDRGRAFLADGLTAIYQGDYARAGERLEAAIALFREAGDRPRLAEALGRRAQAAVLAGDLPRMELSAAESLAMFDELGDRLGPAWTMDAVGLAAVMSGDWSPKVARHLEICSELFEELQDPTGQCLILCLRSVLAGRTGDPAAAQRLAQEMLALATPDEERLTRPLALTTLAFATLAHDLDARDPERAEALARQALITASDVGSLHDLGLALAPLAWAAVELGDPTRAARLLGAAERHSAMVRAPVVQTLLAPAVGQTSATLGADRFAAERAAGGELSLDEATRLGLEAPAARLR